MLLTALTCLAAGSSVSSSASAFVACCRSNALPVAAVNAGANLFPPFASPATEACKKITHSQERAEVGWRPGQETSLAPPCSNIRSFGSKCALLKNCWNFSAPPSDSAPESLCPPCPHRYVPTRSKRNLSTWAKLFGAKPRVVKVRRGDCRCRKALRQRRSHVYLEAAKRK